MEENNYKRALGTVLDYSGLNVREKMDSSGGCMPRK